MGLCKGRELPLTTRLTTACVVWYAYYLCYNSIKSDWYSARRPRSKKSNVILWIGILSASPSIQWSLNNYRFLLLELHMNSDTTCLICLTNPRHSLYYIIKQCISKTTITQAFGYILLYNLILIEPPAMLCV